MSNKVENMGAVNKINLKASNMATEWKNWLSHFHIYLVASKLSEESNARKVALLLHHMGPECLQIFNSFERSLTEVKYNDLVKLFGDYFVPQVNLTMERHTFFTRKQNGGESIDDYITVLRNLSITCDFGELKNDLVKNVFICGLSSNLQHIKERLLSEGDVTLDRAVQIAKNIETARENASQLEGLAMNVLESRSHFSRSNFQQNSNNCIETNVLLKMQFVMAAIKKGTI